MLGRIILFNIIVCFTFLSSASAQQDSGEKFVVVGNLKFRDFNRNGKLDVYEDYRKSIAQRAQSNGESPLAWTLPFPREIQEQERRLEYLEKEWWLLRLA